MNTIKKGDIIGNSKNGFRFQVLEVLVDMGTFFKVIVENISTFEKFETTSDVMNFHGSKYL